MTPLVASHHQDWPAGAVRKDRLTPTYSASAAARTPAGSFIFPMRKDVQTMRLIQIFDVFRRSPRSGVRGGAQRVRKHFRQSSKGTRVHVRRYQRGQRRPR